MSRVANLVRKGKKYQSGTHIKFRNNKNGTLGVKSVKMGGNKTYKPGSHVNLKGKME